MGLYDDLMVMYPLPVGGQDTPFQTKSTNAQWCDRYELRADGTLWHYAENATNEHSWIQEAWTGELNFYTNIGDDGWLEYTALMHLGKLIAIELVEHRLPTIKGETLKQLLGE